MNKDKLENMWKIMREYNFEFLDEINPELICTICKKILINPCHAPCGCRYCKKCIEENFKIDRSCPGDSEYCKDSLINIEKDINIDYPINIKICKLKVKCPISNCETKMSLDMIENHLRICNMKPVRCPYQMIGCDNGQLFIDEINNHLLTEIYYHTKLLMESINILQNDIRSINGYNSEISALKNENRNLSKTLEIVKNENARQILELKTTLNKQNQEIDQLKELINVTQANLQITKDQEITIEKILQVKDKIKIEMNKSICEMKEQLDDLKKKINNTGENIDKIYFEEFIWKIDKWSMKTKNAQNGIDRKIYSDPFYSHRNGYKMCLRADPNGDGKGKGTHLSIFICIMKGPYDDILEWPFKYDVDFSLINQETGLAHITMSLESIFKSEFKINFDKPTIEKNVGVGKPQFMKLEEISNNPALCLNNQIFIKCSLKCGQHR